MGEWTVETLKEYVESRFKAKDEAVKSALTSSEKAVTKAEAAAIIGIIVVIANAVFRR